MIRVSWMPTAWEASAREVSEAPWRNGATVASYAPSSRPWDAVWCNGELVVDPSAAMAGDGDWLTFTRMPGGGVAVLEFIALSTLSFIVGQIFAPRPIAKPGDEESPTYAFSGIRNERADGLPIPIIYGRFRVGGQVLNEFVTSKGEPPISDYYILLALGFGPIEAIGTQTADTDEPLFSGSADFPVPGLIYLDDNPIENWDGIDIHVRLGGMSQTAIPTFPQVHHANPVEFLLEQETTTTSGTSTNFVLTTTDYKTTGTADPIWDIYGETFDLVADVYDGVRVTVEFQGGLYQVSGVGLDDAYFSLMMRYRELDADGDPIDVGSADADGGWVRVYPFSQAVSRRSSPFAIDYTVPFRDPQQFVFPTVGNAYETLGLGDTAASGTLGTLPTQLNTGGLSVDTISVEGWWKVDDPTNTDNYLFDWSNASGTRGFRMEVAPKTIFAQSKNVFSVIFNGLNLSTQSGTFEVAAGKWTHLAFTYQNGGGSHATVVVYQDGQTVTTFQIGANTMKAPGPTQPFIVGGSSTSAATGNFEGEADEVRIMHRALTLGEISVAWGDGVGRAGVDETDLLGGYHFQTDAAGVTPDYSSYAHDLTYAGATPGPPQTGTANGVVFSSATSPLKAGRYRVELMRRNRDSVRADTVDEGTWVNCAGVIDQAFSHPGTALIGMSIRASDQFSGRPPVVSATAKGVLVPIWDGVSEEFPEAPRAWSRNPAWIALDIATNSRYALGAYYDLPDNHLSKFAELAAYCDEIIYDSRGNIQTAVTEFSDVNWDDTYVHNGVITGSLTLEFGASNLPPEHWRVGGYVGLQGINDDAHANVNVDVNNGPSLGGYEIGDIVIDNVANQVVLVYDKDVGTAPWTGAIPASLVTAVSPDALTGTAEGRELRHTFDGVFDKEYDAWDALIDVLAVARAAPIRVGRRLSLWIDRARDPVDVVTRASIIEGSFEVGYSGPRTRPNQIRVEYHDETANYERVPVSLDSLRAQDSTTREALRIERRFVLGISRRAQALRHAAFILNSYELVKRDGVFKQHVDALPYEVGDVLVMDHDLFAGAFGGRVRESGSNSTTAFVSDRTITFLASTTYEARVRSSDDGATDFVVVDVATIGGAGTYAPGTVIELSSALSFGTQKGDVWHVYVQGSEILAQVLSITHGEDMEREVTWAQYDADVHSDQWFEDLDGFDGP